MCFPNGDKHAPDQVDTLAESFYGVIKSYNERRGFGFVACEETARRFGRDVYLSKDEALALSKEPPVGLAASEVTVESEGGPPVKETDCLMFQVQRSTEGFPQAVSARRMCRLQGVVVKAAELGEGESGEGLIVVKGDQGRDGAAAAHLLGAEVRVRQVDCGQLRLAVGDEVAFCCTNATGSSSQLEAQLVELLHTDRTGGTLLGCFSLELPRAVEGDADGAVSLEPAGPPIVLDGHALFNRVVLAGLPSDVGVPELMRVFGKMGATEAMVTFPGEAGEASSGNGSVNGFASVSFGGAGDVGRFLARAAHTVSEQGATQLMHLWPCRRTIGYQVAAPLPALPAPSMRPGSDGAMVVHWQQVSLAAGYSLEMRRAGTGAAWEQVDSPEAAEGGCLPPSCSSCQVAALAGGAAYEARVTYVAACGCWSQASASTECLRVEHAGCRPSSPEVREVPPAAPLAYSSPQKEAFVEAPPLPLSYGAPGAAPAGGFLGTPAPQLLPAADQRTPFVGDYSRAALTHAISAMPFPEWRCPHGNLTPPAAAPELVPCHESGRGICIQWPMVIHAVAYTVELYEDGAATAERFARSVPEGMAEALVELRVGNLQPGGYAACIRCTAPCGCESQPSPWSFLPPAWQPHAHHPALHPHHPWQAHPPPTSHLLPPHLEALCMGEPHLMLPPLVDTYLPPPSMLGEASPRGSPDLGSGEALVLD